jgi:hypothetical protein
MTRRLCESSAENSSPQKSSVLKFGRVDSFRHLRSRHSQASQINEEAHERLRAFVHNVGEIVSRLCDGFALYDRTSILAEMFRNVSSRCLCRIRRARECSSSPALWEEDAFLKFPFLPEAQRRRMHCVFALFCALFCK